MPGKLLKCPNCKTVIKRESDYPDYCKKCGMRLYFRCRRCEAKWFRIDGILCPQCGRKNTNEKIVIDT